MTTLAEQGRVRRGIERLMREVRTVAYWCLDSVALLLRPARTETALIVRLDNIGDFVVWLQSGAGDVVAELRRHHQRVVMIGNIAWAGLAQDLGLFDEVLGVSPAMLMRHPYNRLRTMLAIRRFAAKTVINPRGGRVYLMEDEIVRISGALDRIAVRGLLLNIDRRLMARSDRYYTRLIDAGADNREHEAIRNERFANQFCTKRGTRVDPTPLLLHKAPAVPARFFAVAPGAGTPGRRWPVAYFVPVIENLHRRTGLPCVIVGSAADHAAAVLLQQTCQAPVLDQTGCHSLSDTLVTLASAEMLVTNDSGPLHLAIWAGTPVVALMGGGQFGWFAPYPQSVPHADLLTVVNHPMLCYGCDWHCRFDIGPTDSYPCVAHIPIAQVIVATEKVADMAMVL